FYQTFFQNHLNTEQFQPDDVYIDFSEEMQIADDPDALIDMVSGKLLGGVMTDTLRQEIFDIVSAIPATDAALRAAETIFLVVSSPEFATQM
nr:hypothetical protein [Woeseiaceae bacterium]